MRLLLVVGLLACTGCKFDEGSSPQSWGEAAPLEPELQRELAAFAQVREADVELRYREMPGDLSEGERRHYDVVFTQLSAESCARLHFRFGSSDADCALRREHALSEFLPQGLARLAGRGWERAPAKWEGRAVEFVMTSTAAAYEAVRQFVSPRSARFNIFFAPQASIAQMFERPPYFTLVAEVPLAGLDALLQGEFGAVPGDVLTVYGESLMHAAVVVAPGVVFEKVGSVDNPHFRMVPISYAKRDWVWAKKVVLRRPTAEALPEPAAVFATRKLAGQAVADDLGHTFGMVLVDD